MSELLDFALLEQNPKFILDTNALNRLPTPMLDVFDFYCPAGVVKEIEKWSVSVEMLPLKIAEKEKELAEEEEALKLDEQFDGVRESAEYSKVSEVVERFFVGERIEQLRDKVRIDEWEEAIRREYREILDEFDRERREHNLRFVKKVLSVALLESKRVKVRMYSEDSSVLDEHFGGRADLETVSRYCRQLAPIFALCFEDCEGCFIVGRGEVGEETCLPFIPYKFLNQKKQNIQQLSREYQALKKKYEELQTKEDERKNSLAVIQKLQEQGKVIWCKDDWVMSTIRSYTGILSKTVARDVVREYAADLARGERALPFVERGMELYQRRKVRTVEEVYEERFKEKLKAHISQLIAKIQNCNEEAEITSIADEFSSVENLRVDVEVLRAAFQKSEEFPDEAIFIVTDDSDVIDLFLLSRELRARLFQNVRYCEFAVLEKFYLRLRQVKERLDRLGC